MMLKTRILNAQITKPAPLKKGEELGDFLIRFPDGTIHYDKAFRLANLDTIKGRIKEFISVPIYSLENYNSFSEQDMNNFTQLIRQMRQKGIIVEFLFIPYPREVYDYFIKKISIVKDFEDFIRSFAKENDILTSGSYNPSFSDVSDEYFYDGMHLNELGIEKIMAGKRF